MDEMVRRLRALRNSAAEEIGKASLTGERGVFAAVVRARDALNDALVAAGDLEAIASAQTHCSLDEMSLWSRLEGWMFDGFGMGTSRQEARGRRRPSSWWHFACLVAGLAAGYLSRPWVDCWASALRLWWSYVS